MDEENFQGLLDRAAERPLSEILLGYDDFAFAAALQVCLRRGSEVQQTVLAQILSCARDTEFGREHGFAEITSFDDFRERVPLSEWSDYEDYSRRLREGEENLLYPGRTTYFYKTSGTTSDYKLIPESEAETYARRAVNRARNVEILRMGGPEVARRIFAFFNRPSWTLSEAGIPIGSASGRTTELSDSSLASHLTYPPQMTNEVEQRDLRYMTARASLAYPDVSFILGNNALMLREFSDYVQENAETLIDEIRRGVCSVELGDEVRGMMAGALRPNPERADELQRLLDEGRLIPAHYWPDLVAASFWLGGSVGVYVEQIRPLLPEGVKLIDVGYGASEARINIPLEPDTPAGALACFAEFFEFLPLTGGEPLLMSEVEVGEQYELVITTNAGLYRYQLHDIVEIDGFVGQTPLLHFVTKVGDVANLAQEKLAGVVLLEQTRRGIEELGNELVALQIYPDPETTSYVFHLELADAVDDVDGLAERLDAALRERLVQYELFRVNALGPLSVSLMKPGWRDHLMEVYAKDSATKAQVKVPVILRDRPDPDWIIA